MQEAIANLNAGRLIAAESIVRQHLNAWPADPAGLCLLGDLAARSGIYPEAERLFRRALSVAPLLTDAQLNLARLLALRDGVPEAIEILEAIYADLPERWDIALRRLSLMAQIGDYQAAASAYARLLVTEPDRPEIWLGYANLQKTIGDTDASIAAYRRAIALGGEQGEAWWGLANLKTYVFDDAEIARMAALATSPAADLGVRSLIHFSLGKALDDRGDTAASFAHYRAGNDARKATAPYDAAETRAEVDRSIDYFRPSLFERLADLGHPSSDPIFIVGLPRSGSTLVEQILASHPLVEGTSELPYIPMLVHRLLAEFWTDRSLRYPEVLEQIAPARLRDLGQAYLDAAAIHRREGRRFFIDKLPNNWNYVGFIQLILPNARIVDARRAPMACCWSNYRQWFARGQEFSYDLNDLANYYRDYVRLMNHFDAVLPGRVRRVSHEDLLADPDTGIRRLIADLGLPAADACLRFHENMRPVRTASAQQVRRPIDRTTIDQWRRFEPALASLRDELGDLA